MKNYILEYFLKYVKINTMSSEDSTETPSTKCQYDLANVLVNDLKELGLKNVKLLDHCFVVGELESNSNSNLTIGFIAHMDTIPGFSGKDVKPNVINNYDGNTIKLKNIELNPNEFTFLNNLKGKTLITTDGTTVLGADDKAGIANIMGMLKYFSLNKDIPHVNIKVAFTPDEEIGGGIGLFDVKGFNADFAYTVDGELYDEINYENFNAASANITINGLDIHPGNAKGHMINSSLVAMEFNSLLNPFERPEYTELYDGFNHLVYINGEVGKTNMTYILRNHNKELLKKQKDEFINARDFLNKKYGSNTVVVDIKDSYYNMRDIIDKDMRSVNTAIKAMKKLGITPKVTPIRGGTDGARLTQMGLLTPNIGTGGYNPHGPYELACLEEMEIVSKILIEIAKND